MRWALGRSLALLLLCASACTEEAEPADATAMIVRLDADDAVKADIGALRVRVQRRVDGTFEHRLDRVIEVGDGFAWPHELTLVPDAEPDGVLELMADALDGDGNALVRARVVAAFEPGMRVSVPLFFASACRGRLGCEDDAACHGPECGTCRGGACVETGVLDAPAYDATKSVADEHDDAFDVQAAVDAGDSASDAEAPTDAGDGGDGDGDGDGDGPLPACNDDDGCDRDERCDDGQCVAMQCGDDVVDVRADEQCDDGADGDDDDGCTDSCAYSCESDADCGVRLRCDDHVCVELELQQAEALYGGVLDGIVLEMNGLGDALVLWTEGDADRSVGSTLYEPGSGWSEPGAFATPEVGEASYPNVATDTRGGFFVTYTTQLDIEPNPGSLMARRYMRSGAWAEPFELRAFDTTPDAGDVSMLPNGDVLVLWSSREPNHTLSSILCDDGQTACLEREVESFGEWAETATGLSSDVGFVAWVLSGDPAPVVRAKTSDPFDWIETPAILHEAAEGAQVYLSLIGGEPLYADELGRAVLGVSTQSAAMATQSAIIEYDDGWQPLEPLHDCADASLVCYGPVLAGQPNGTVAAITLLMTQPDFVFSIAARTRIGSASAWTELEAGPEQLEGYAGFQLASGVDAEGGLLLAWLGKAGVRNDVMAVRYAPDSGWSDIVTVRQNVDMNAIHQLEIAMQPDGRAAIAWVEEGEDEDTLWAALVR